MAALRLRSGMLVGLTLVVLPACTPRNQYAPPPPPEVTVNHPVEREVAEYLEFTGTMRAVDTVEIRARVNGYLKEIKFADGADVEKDQLLFIIEQEPFQVALESAQANLQKAVARRTLADAELKRTEPLVARGALPQQELDLKRADLEIAKADVVAANAAIDQAKLNLTYTEVRAPISGRVSQHMVDIGNLVRAETTLMTRIETYSPIHAYFSVSEKDMLRLPVDNSLLTSASQASDDNPAHQVFLGLPDSDGYPFQGTLDFAQLGVDPATGTQMRRASFPNEDCQLTPGMFVRIRVNIGQAKPKLLIDERAVATDQQGEYLLIVKDDNVVERRDVRLGMRNQGMRVVESGVTLEDWIVVNGVQRARPGGHVTPKEKEAPAEDTVQHATSDKAEEHVSQTGE